MVERIKARKFELTIPYPVGAVVRVLQKGHPIKRLDVIEEVSTESGYDWSYVLCHAGAWYDHSELQLIRPPDQESIKEIIKAKGLEYEETHEDVKDF